MSQKWKKWTCRILAFSWLILTVAFFSMITSAGTESMELRIGPFLALEGLTATVFVQGLIAYGLVMLALIIPLRRTGVVMSLGWSAMWALLLSTTIPGASNNSERSAILVTVGLFVSVGWYSWGQLVRSKKGGARSKPTSSKPSQ